MAFISLGPCRFTKIYNCVNIDQANTSQLKAMYKSLSPPVGACFSIS